MATTNYGLNSPETVKLWSRKLFREALKRTWMSKFMGSSSDSMIQIAEDTSKGPGDRVRVTLRMLLTGAGVSGDGTLEGNEEALTTYTDNIVIDQLRHAVRSGGKMSEQRIPFAVREEARQGLTDWWADRIDSWAFNQLAGTSIQTDTRYTGMQAVTEPSSNNIVIWDNATHTTEASVNSASASCAIQLTHIDTLVTKAKTLTPQIRPLKVSGEDYYVMFLHPNQVQQLRTDATANRVTWYDTQKAAMGGGRVDNNPIFTGALGIYNGVIMHESTRVPLAGSASTLTNAYRAIFCGAQAACMAFGRGFGGNQMSWTEELFDYRNQLGVSAGLIGGVKKTIFNSQDFGSIVYVSGFSG